MVHLAPWRRECCRDATAKGLRWHNKSWLQYNTLIHVVISDSVEIKKNFLQRKRHEFCRAAAKGLRRQNSCIDVGWSLHTRRRSFPRHLGPLHLQLRAEHGWQGEEDFAVWQNYWKISKKSRDQVTIFTQREKFWWKDASSGSGIYNLAQSLPRRWPTSEINFEFGEAKPRQIKNLFPK